MAKQNKAAAEAAANKAAETNAEDPEGKQRVYNARETIQTSPQADPEAKPKLFKTSDGELFYQETHALMHARELDDKSVTEVEAEG
jgi:hypothetical protein